MITIKRLKTTVNYPFDELIKVLKNNPKPDTIPLRMIGINSKFLLAPRTTIKDSEVHIQERRLNAIFYSDRNGNTVVEYRYEIYWIILIIWILAIFLLVGIFWVPLIVISSRMAISYRINKINKHAYNALMELNPIETQSKPSAKIEKIIEPIPVSSKTPPPIKKHNTKTEYFIGVDGEQMGPYDLEKIKLLIEFKNIDGSTLIWKEGMEDWDTLSNIEELENELIKKNN